MSYERINFKNLPSNETPVNATNLNKMDLAIKELMTGWISLDIPVIFAFWNNTTKTGVINTSEDLTNTLSVGMKFKLTQSSSIKYGIITALTSTQITVFFGTDYTLSNVTISDVYFSEQNSPFGFDKNPDKWTIKVIDTSLRYQQNPIQNTYYNLNSNAITVPTGLWNLSFSGLAETNKATSDSGGISHRAVLSTVNNGMSDAELSCQFYSTYASSLMVPFSKCKLVSISSETIYYYNIMTDLPNATYIRENNHFSTLILKAVCAYL